MSWALAVAVALATPTPEVAAQLARLEGQRVTIAAGGASFTIDDIAGEGPPRVGVIERRGEALWLVEDGDAGNAWRLRGPLARPRIAGPGYRVWVLGDGDAHGATLRARRLGVLAPPHRGAPLSASSPTRR